METKICKTCKQSKPVDDYSQIKDGRGTMRTNLHCSECFKEYKRVKKNEFKNKRINEDKEKYVQDLREAYAKWYSKNGENFKEINRKKSAKYRSNNIEKVRKIRREYCSNRYKADPQFRLKRIMNSQIKRALNGKAKTSTTFSLLGYSNKTLQEYLGEEIQMFIDNDVLYHIDHKIPLSWFKDETPIHLTFDLRNLHIISEDDNLNKNHYYPSIADKQYMQEIRQYIKEEYLCW